MSLEQLVDQALAEDVGAGDVTTEATVDADARAVARIIQKAPGVIFGLDAAEATFRALDPDAAVPARGRRGRVARPGRPGPARRRPGPRAAHGRAHGAELPRPPVRRRHRRPRAACARSRAPAPSCSTRARPRRACACSRRPRSRAGGGVNHRAGLYDYVLIKENHIDMAGGVAAAVQRARAAAPDARRSRSSAARPTEVDEALEAGATRLLLDNMTPEQMRAVVEHVGGRAELEASGGITLENVREYADERRTLDIDRCPDALRPRPRPLPPGGAPLKMPTTFLTPESIPRLQDEVRALARERERGHPRPQLPAARDPGGRRLRRRLARALAPGRGRSSEAVIVFCGVHFMAETASILCPEKTVLLPDLDAGCSLADSITAAQLRAWKADHPGAVVVMYVNTTAEVKAETDYCVTSSNAVARGRAHLPRARARTPRSSSAPTCSSAPTSSRRSAARMHVWDGECHVHAGIRPLDITTMRAEHPGRRLPHPPRVRVLDLGDGVRRRRRHRPRGRSTCSRPAGCSSRPRSHGDAGQADRRDRDRHAPPAARGRARRGVHPRQPRGLLPVHEDDHAAEAARRAARRAPRGEGVPGDRRARARIPIERMVSIG